MRSPGPFRADVGRTRRVAALGLGLVLALALPATANQAGTATLSPADEAALARAFAPTFVLHPDERYFPTSPLLDVSSLAGVVRDMGHLGEAEAIAARARAYVAEPLELRAAAAVVYYRVVALDRSSRGDAVVEYWLYYLWNEYRVRGGLFPYRVNDVHPHDLERASVFITRRPGAAAASWADTDFSVSGAIGSAHLGGIPSNTLALSGGRPPIGTPAFLVELGSHALAPDADRDGRFTAGIDSSGSTKFVWGIRDAGDTWAWRHRDDSDARAGDRAIRLYPSSAARDASCRGVTRCFPYELQPSRVLDGPTDTTRLTRDERLRALGPTPWLHRLFSQVDTSTLLAPSAHPDARHPETVLGRLSHNERGLVAGIGSSGPRPSVVAGARYAIVVAPIWLPNLLVDGLTRVTWGRAVIHDGSLFAYYQIDAIAKVVVGPVVRTSASFEDARTSLAAGAEFQVGRWRARVTARDFYRQLWIDTRVVYILFQ